MSKAAELIAAGVLTQDPTREDRVVWNVPFLIRKEIIDGGGIEAFAAAFGWSEFVSGNAGAEPNPIAAHEAAVTIVHDFVREQFRVILIRQAEEQARQQAQRTAEQLLS